MPDATTTRRVMRRGRLASDEAADAVVVEKKPRGRPRGTSVKAAADGKTRRRSLSTKTAKPATKRAASKSKTRAGSKAAPKKRGTSKRATKKKVVEEAKVVDETTTATIIPDAKEPTVEETTTSTVAPIESAEIESTASTLKLNWKFFCSMYVGIYLAVLMLVILIIAIWFSGAAWASQTTTNILGSLSQIYIAVTETFYFYGYAKITNGFMFARDGWAILGEMASDVSRSVRVDLFEIVTAGFK